MRPVKGPDRHVMGDEAAKALTGEPRMEMKSRRLDLERRLAQVIEVEVDRMVGDRADRTGTARKHR